MNKIAIQYCCSEAQIHSGFVADHARLLINI